MGQILLAPEEIEQAIREAISKQSYLDITVKQRYEAIAKAQLKKVMTDAPWKLGAGIRFLSEEEYQALFKEAEMEE